MSPRRSLGPHRPRAKTRGARRRSVATALIVGPSLLGMCACSPGSPDVGQISFTVPNGASFGVVVDTLEARELVSVPLAFEVVARVRGDDRGVRAGTYEVPADIGWIPLLEHLVAGRVVTVPLTIPEGYTLAQIAPPIAEFTQAPVEEVLAALEAPNAASDWRVPGPTLEGYLFPDTYLFAPGVPLDSIVSAMVERHRSFWTDERRARAAELGFTEAEVTTLASIVQGEARVVDEMPVISGVYHNRLEIGYLLQADPTIQYALGGRRERLLYADIDSVADHPYNTYTNPGLPPGPIGAPGEAALEAALNPADVEFLYFVARPDGSHIFTRSLQEHNNARIEARREWDALERAQDGG